MIRWVGKEEEMTTREFDSYRRIYYVIHQGNANISLDEARTQCAIYTTLAIQYLIYNIFISTK